jgi:hypothetical protein
MAMVKIISPSGWDFDAPIASTIKIASRGLLGADRSDFVKRAGDAANIFLPYLDKVKFAADEEPVHLIALGASEAYGPNRNGDGFKEATCKSCHDSFVKHAKWYRNHKNKDPLQSYGSVKLSAYNPTMRRVELLVGLNKTKEAAERNKGFVADKELEKLAMGQDLPVSMACRVAHDVCSYCNHSARTRDEYCTSSMCKAGGCKDNLTRLIKVGNDVHHLHVDNPNPGYFDISFVFRPADRIAYANKADWLQKAASDGGFFDKFGAEAAEALGVVAPLSLVLQQDHNRYDRPWVNVQVKLAYGLDALEQGALLPSETRRAFAANVQAGLNYADLQMLVNDTEKTAAALSALAERKIILPLREYAKFCKAAQEVVVDAQRRLPGVYGRMLADGSLDRHICNSRYSLLEKQSSVAQRDAAFKAASGYSLEKTAVDNRCMLSTLRQHPVPEVIDTYGITAVGDSGETLAREYAIYKLAALTKIASTESNADFLLTCRMSLCQNQVV